MAHYGGNPLALKDCGDHHSGKLFGGDVGLFLQQGAVIFGDIADLLEQQFNRLLPLEKEIMYWLAIQREWMTLTELQADLLPPVAIRHLIESLESLQLRSLIEQRLPKDGHPLSFTQQPVVMEYVTESLVQSVFQELVRGPLELFNSHALTRAQAQDYLRNTQIRQTLQPLANKLLAQWGSQETANAELQQVLLELHKNSVSQSGYGAGNLINLLGQLKVDLCGLDFSNLTVRQAYLGGLNLQRVDFSGADLAQSVFTQTLGILFSATFSPCGKYLAIGIGNAVHLWSINDNRPVLTCQGHSGWVQSLAFSPDGQSLASGGHDQSVRIWDVETGQCLKTLKGIKGCRPDF